MPASEIALIGSFELKHGENESDHDLADQENGGPKVLFFRCPAAMNDRVSQVDKVAREPRGKQRDVEELLEERAALLALAWFAREPGVADWPRIYAWAGDMVGPPDDGYDIGLGSYWLAGLRRWEEPPPPEPFDG